MKKLSIPLGTLLLTALFIAQPKPAHAVAVGAVVCTVNVFPCPVANSVDAGVRVAGPAVLPFNSYAILGFTFTDAFMTFTGTVLTVDRRVGNVNAIYSWGTGVATDNFGAGAGGYLDIGISQTYQTLAGLWGFSEINIGSCNAGGVLNSNVNGAIGPGSASGSLVEGVVNGAGLPILAASCGGVNPWVLGAGPFAGVNITNSTNLTSYGQFFFNAGANPGLNQAITLPWGDDFPDPNSYGGGFPTLNQLTSDSTMTDVTPEPATYALFGGALFLFAMVRRRGK